MSCRGTQATQVTGTFFSAQLAAKQMKQQGTEGSILMIASVCAHVAIPGHHLSAYHASKGAVKMLMTALSVELAPHAIRCNSISPGYIESDMTRGLREQHPHLVDIMNNAPPMKRIGNRNDLTGAAVYLLSDAASYTTGTDIPVTGGLHAGRIEA
jgi:NAD(P)-dependent dehydrogenase (short-subunit alcohol dehydrogenase family)